ncbi:MAG: hypothetical protein IKU80_06070 [Firmicutes bacterium]|nr:hypothetical protein [Bacillota bacterium]
MKKIMAAASFDKQKYYMDEEFLSLPQGIKDEVQTICVYLAEKLMCTFVVGFYEDDGDVYFETVRSEEVLDFDDIGAELEIKSLQKEKSELIKALKMWYLIYKTDRGEEIKQKLLKGEEVDV